LGWSGSNILSLGDFSTTAEIGTFQNNTGNTILINELTFSFLSSETTWGYNKIFTSTSTAGTSYITFGDSSDGTVFDTEYLDFANSILITPYLTTFDHPDLTTGTFYNFKIDKLNLPVSSGDYFICELSGNFSATGDKYFCAGIVYDKNLV
jgi:hypothetical protein